MVQTDSTHSLQMSDVGGNLLIRSPNKSNFCELSTKFTHERNLLFGIYYLYPLQRGAGGTGTRWEVYIVWSQDYYVFFWLLSITDNKYFMLLFILLSTYEPFSPLNSVHVGL